MEKTTISIFKEDWLKINREKKHGESFATTVNRLLEVIELD